MTEMAVSEAREQLADVVNRVAYSGESTYLTRRGRRMAAVVPAEVLERIEQLEDELDNEAADAALAEIEESGEPVAWDTLRADLLADDAPAGGGSEGEPHRPGVEWGLRYPSGDVHLLVLSPQRRAVEGEEEFAPYAALGTGLDLVLRPSPDAAWADAGADEKTLLFVSGVIAAHTEHAQHVQHAAGMFAGPVVTYSLDSFDGTSPFAGAPAQQQWAVLLADGTVLTPDPPADAGHDVDVEALCHDLAQQLHAHVVHRTAGGAWTEVVR